MMKYRLICTDRAYFEDVVRRAIAEGWVPQGGVSAFAEAGQAYFAQALIRMPQSHRLADTE